MFCALLARRCRKRVGLTGTPMPHSPLDLYGQARALDPALFGRSWTAFRARYARVGGASGTEVLAFQHQDELWAKFHSLAFVRSAEECTDLPPLTEQVVAFPLSPKARAIYRRLEEHFWAAVEAGTVTLVNALGRLTRLQQVTSGYLPLDDTPGDIARIAEVDDGKAAALDDLLDDLIGEPVVVICRFRHDLDRVERIAERRGLRYGEVSGRRTDLTADATMPEDVDLMAVQIQAGGVGIDLTRARIGVFYSVGFSLGDLQQVQARLHRQGQLRHVTLVHLVAENTVDETIREALESNRQIIELILERGRPPSKETAVAA
jgi:SNF2 family DNA or RNA helicase